MKKPIHHLSINIVSLLALTGLTLGCSAMPDFANCIPGDPCKEGYACDKATNTCRLCREHSECDSGLCVLDEAMASSTVRVGQCVSKSKIAQVNNQSGVCSVSGPIYCEINQALQQDKTYLWVAASNTPYSSVKVNANKVVLIGPGKDAPNKATLNALAIEGQGNVLVDGLMIRPTEKFIGISCKGDTSSLFLRNSVIQGGAAQGILADSCKEVNIERSAVRENFLAGIQVNNTPYRIINSLVRDNGNSPMDNEPGVILGAGSVGVFAFNTVLNNGPGSTNGLKNGGIKCMSDNLITDSVVFNNSSNIIQADQFTGSCKFERVVVDPQEVSMATGLIKLNPQLDAQGKLTKDSFMCIDKALARPEITTDFYGTSRPIGAGYDIGFHEYQP